MDGSLNSFGLARAPDMGVVNDGSLVMPQFYDFDLATAHLQSAGTDVYLENIVGNFLYIDPGPDVSTLGMAALGTNRALIRFGHPSADVMSAPFFVHPGFTYRGAFRGIRIENGAQGGRTLRIVYGFDFSIISGTSAIQAVTGTSYASALPVIDSGNVTPGAVFVSTTPLGAGAVETIIAPATNASGMCIHRALLVSNMATASSFSLLCKSSAPTGSMDGDTFMHGYAHAAAPAGFATPAVLKPQRFSSGRGFYRWASAAETACALSCAYTLGSS